MSREQTHHRREGAIIMSRRGVVLVDFPSLIDVITKSTLERKGPSSALSSSGREIKAGIWRQKLK